ncbi:MAG: PEP-CTERM sorting domain-containing protein [Planctomycetota bacterium]
MTDVESLRLSQIPEPASLALAGLGGLLTLGRRRAGTY